MKLILICFFLIICGGKGDLLEMSKILWSKFINGSYSANIQSIDPLRVPIVKVDQSQGNLSYRIILKNIEIHGLNESSLESIHIQKGKVKSNLSNYEAGYVSYSDRSTLDSIRYRFHTLVKESPNQNVEKLVGVNYEQRKSGNLRVSPDAYSEKRVNGGEKVEEEEEEESGKVGNRFGYVDQRRMYVNTDGRYHQQRYHQSQSNYRQPEPVYRQKSENNERYNYQEKQYSPTESNQHSNQRNYLVYAQRPKNSDETGKNQGQGQAPIYVHYKTESSNSEPQDYHAPLYIHSKAESSNINSQNHRTPQYVQSRAESSDSSSQDRQENHRSPQYAQSKVESSGTNSPCDKYEKSEVKSTEKQPNEYIDIIYANENDRKVKHFGNLKLKSTDEVKTVYSIEDLLRDLDNHRRFIIHNFTNGESLLKKNDAGRVAEETRRINDLIRYAKDFQEKEGFFEEGMELIYHYGNDSNQTKVFDGKRIKRAHQQDDDDDDDEENDENMMHLIVRIRVPFLQVKAGYVLMGKVGNEILRGDGLLDANFSDVVGDFTVEFKKVGNETLIVRAARAKLQAKSQNIDLEGMNENGPVSKILTQGLMAAEVVAAMLADDLATKALNQHATDAIIYKMYKDLP